MALVVQVHTSDQRILYHNGTNRVKSIPHLEFRFDLLGLLFYLLITPIDIQFPPQAETEPPLTFIPIPSPTTPFPPL